MRRLLLLMLLSVAACGDGTSDTMTSSVSTSTTVPTSTSTVATTTTAVTTTMAATPTTADPVRQIEIVVYETGYELVVDGISLGRGARVAVEQGGKVRITASGEVEEQIHIHGYDLSMDVEPGVENEIEFVADIPGIFEVEMEGSHTEVFELEVS
jgi:heme/copper-type cytochrome/quinol oxidase subunit 2